MKSPMLYSPRNVFTIAESGYIIVLLNTLDSSSVAHFHKNKYEVMWGQSRYGILNLCMFLKKCSSLDEVVNTGFHEGSENISVNMWWRYCVCVWSTFTTCFSSIMNLY
jgi:hypothetical protein